MKREFYDIKESFALLRILAERMNVLHEIRETYPSLDNMTLEEVENFLVKRYADIENKLGEQLNME